MKEEKTKKCNRVIKRKNEKKRENRRKQLLNLIFLKKTIDNNTVLYYNIKGIKKNEGGFLCVLTWQMHRTLKENGIS